MMKTSKYEMSDCEIAHETEEDGKKIEKLLLTLVG